MEPTHLLVHHAAAVADGRDKDLALEQVAPAEAALAVAAVGVDGDGGAFQSHGHGLGRLRVDDMGLVLCDTMETVCADQEF